MEHKDIPDSGLHEPKGVATAAAGTTYVADGSGSGSWIIPEPKGASTALDGQTIYASGSGSAQWAYPPQGWGNYDDSIATTQVLTTTPATFTTNGLGPGTEESYLPKEIRGLSSLWDATNNLIIPVAVGDSYDVRVDFTVTAATGSPSYVLMELDVGAPGVPFIAMQREIQVQRTALPFEVSVGFPIFCMDNFLANGGRILLSTDTGTFTIGQRSIFISRNFGER